MRRNSSKLSQFFTAVPIIAPLILALFALPATVAYAQPSGGCTGISNITVGSTTYAPTWCQEFNGGAGSPDTSVWKFDLGNNGGWGNGEAEVYCGPPGYSGNPSQCPTTFSTATAPVYIDGNGHLVIRPINENGKWLSGRMTTEGLEDFSYGILEASVELPDTTDQGLWPAFWTLGSDISTVAWPGCGEADILENWSPQVDNGAGTTGENSTIHTAKTGGGGIGKRYTFAGGQATNTAFHTYGVIWVANEMQFFVDDANAPFFSVTPSNLPSGDTWPFNQNIFAILNVAVGGTLGGSDGDLASPAQPMTVDYVRWYTPTTSVCEADPSAPTNLVATASSSSVINLTWSEPAPPANCTISSYNVYRSISSGFTPGSSNLIASGVTSPSYSNSGLAASTTYYYLVEAVDSYGTSVASNEAYTTTEPGGSGGTVLAINFAGPAISNSGGGDVSFSADEDYSGGGKATPTTHAISTTAAGANAAPMAVYQTQRDGKFSYTIPGLVAGSQHTVLLHFAEIYFNAAGKREFNVAINGTNVLTNFDPFAAAGGEYIAVVKSFSATANSSGQIVVAFTSGADNQPSAAGIEIR